MWRQYFESTWHRKGQQRGFDFGMDWKKISAIFKTPRMFFQLPVNGFRKHVIDVSCSNSVTCVLMKGGIVYTMGRNNEGQRGLGKVVLPTHQTKINKILFLLGYCNNVHEPTVVSFLQHVYIKVSPNCDLIRLHILILFLVDFMYSEFQKVRCFDTYCVAYTEENVSYIWGLRHVKHFYFLFFSQSKF